MKILQEGTRPDDSAPTWIGVYRCHHCTTKIEIEHGDEDMMLDLHKNARSASLVLIECPVCKQVRWFTKIDDPS